ncbi:hypothetical protein GSY69_13885, partial [Brevibacterium sp. 5221]|nr:hypothetical protein [Brevibacterium rongguiense]
GTTSCAPAAQRAGLGWRTRVQLAVDPAGTPGAHAAGSHDVVPVATLPLAVPELEALGLHRLSLPGAERVEMAVGSGPEPTGAVIVSGAPSAAALTAVRTALSRAQGEWSLFARAGGQRNRGGRGRARGRAGLILSGKASANFRAYDLTNREELSPNRSFL